MALELIDQEPLAPPLEFLTKDRIHPDNQKIVEEERMRYRALTWAERWQLKREARRLRQKLKKAKYNALVIQREKLFQEYTALRARWEQEPEQRRQLAPAVKSVIRAGREANESLAFLLPDLERWKHYEGWLEYERQNRAELKRESKREKRIRAEMDKESKWLESLLLDVWRKTPKCHHITTDGKGKTRTRVPKFMKRQIGPDAHYFWLAASKKVLFGYRWLLPYGVTIDDLISEEVIKNMHAATKREVTAQWTNEGQLVFRVSRLDSPDALPKLVKWSDTRDYFPEAQRHKLPYCLGAAEQRKFKWFDFASEPHLLVAGKTQSGKSNLINGIIATSLITHTPDELRIVLIDQKGGIEFTHWSEVPHLLWEMAKTTEQVLPVLDRLVIVMKKRMALLEKVRAKDIDAYNKKVDEKLPRILCVFDELAAVTGLGALTENIHTALALIASQGRATGIHLIAATQHPEVRVIPGRIKTNMSMRVSGPMPSVTASQIILDNPEAARLPSISGRFIAVVGLKTITVQVPFITDADIAWVVSKCKNDYANTSDELAEMVNAPVLKVWDETAVINLALELTLGHLGGQKMHKLLGDESPGERLLNTLCKKIIDRTEASGGVLEHGEKLYKIKKKGKGYHLIEIEPDQTDETEPLETEDSVSDQGLDGAAD